MNKKLTYLFALFILGFCTFLFIFKNEIIYFLINLDITSKNFKILYIILSSIYFLSPLPVTVIILLNGFFFREYGFLISIVQISLGSIFLKQLSNQINKFLKIDLNYKKVNLNRLLINNYSIFFSRMIVPYFLHNIYYGLTKVQLSKFIIIIFLAEIPMTYALSQIGKSLSEITSDFSVSLYTLLTDINFYIPFLIIFVLFITTNYLNKNKR
tara:strand:- start:7106 stop:7741 length:636 start_codon:yes stop_codon:yes gene_type:complete